MMNGKIILLLITVAAVGMFAVPSTLALYTGSHQFVNGANVNCEKCHTSSMDDIKAELESGSAHNTLGCKACHGGGNSAANLEPDTADGHAASMNVDCIGCHFSLSAGGGHTADCSTMNCHADFSKPVEDVLYQLNLATAAHHELTFNASADNQDIDDRDQACIACHTNVPVNITDASLSTTSGTIWIKGNSENLWDT
ncbi:MAG: hypothetical protein GQ533_06695, partial [Methanosarcinaceae archaeon]|nr:hypothetical protein [Methanosarcinaceae archaeon]